jgi:hypothetical protein
MKKSAQTVKKDTAPNTKKQDNIKQDNIKPNTRNQDTTIINRSINNFSTNSFINQSGAASPQIDSIDNFLNNISFISKKDVANKISLQELLNESPNKTELINFIYNILCETLATQPKSPVVWINRRNTPFQEVFNAFSQINKKHCEYVIFSCYNNDNLIKAKNPKAYDKHSLMRSTLTLENFDSRKFVKLETRTPEQIRRDELIEAKIKRDQERMYADIRKRREEELINKRQDDMLNDMDYDY